MDLNAVLQEEHNYKSKLINWAQKNYFKIRFENRASDNLKGKKIFTSRCFINNKLIAEAEDYTIKGADQLAAEKAYEQLHKNEENG
jgi:ribonuclease-3